MPIPATRLLAIIEESESALAAYRELADGTRAVLTAHAGGAYTAPQALHAIRELLAEVPPPRGETTAVERAYWNRHAAPAAARRATAAARRINAALAAGHDPDARTTPTAPVSIAHPRGAIPPTLTTPKAWAAPTDARAHHPTATHTVQAQSPAQSSDFPVIPDTPPPALTLDDAE